MTMAPLGTPASISRVIFQRARKLSNWIKDVSPQYSFKHLSMGMSGDFEIAVEQGATLVRVGTALFGQRP